MVHCDICDQYIEPSIVISVGVGRLISSSAQVQGGARPRLRSALSPRVRRTGIDDCVKARRTLHTVSDARGMTPSRKIWRSVCILQPTTGPVIESWLTVSIMESSNPRIHSAAISPANKELTPSKSPDGILTQTRSEILRRASAKRHRMACLMMYSLSIACLSLSTVDPAPWLDGARNKDGLEKMSIEAGEHKAEDTPT